MNRFCQAGDIVRSKWFHCITIPKTGVLRLDHLYCGDSNTQNGWLVTSVVKAGGQTGRDPWPDYHFVTVQFLCGANDKPSTSHFRLSFYQEGSYGLVVPPDEIELLEEVDLITLEEAKSTKRKVVV